MLFRSTEGNRGLAYVIVKQPQRFSERYRRHANTVITARPAIGTRNFYARDAIVLALAVAQNMGESVMAKAVLKDEGIGPKQRKIFAWALMLAGPREYMRTLRELVHQTVDPRTPDPLAAGS